MSPSRRAKQRSPNFTNSLATRTASSGSEMASAEPGTVETPAMVLGIADRPVRLEEMMGRRLFVDRVGPDASTRRLVERRMRDARSELSHFSEYDYLVINDDFNVALVELRAIVAAERLREPRQAARFSGALAEMLG